MAVTNNTGIDFADDLTQNAIADLSSTLVSGVDSVSVVRGQTFASDEVDQTGGVKNENVDVEAVIADFTAGLPAQRATVTLDSVKWYVSEIRQVGNGATCIIALARNVEV